MAILDIIIMSSNSALSFYVEINLFVEIISMLEALIAVFLRQSSSILSHKAP